MAELKHPFIVSYHDQYHLQEGEHSYICIVQVSIQVSNMGAHKGKFTFARWASNFDFTLASAILRSPV